MAVVKVIPSTINKMTQFPFGDMQKRKVAAYARVSTDSDEQYTSYESQVNYYSKFIKSKPDWDYVEVYADEGISGTSTKNRRMFLQMIKDAEAGKIDLIITKSISRFARNTLDTISYTRKLKAKGIEVYFEKENLWSLDDKAEFLLTIVGAAKGAAIGAIQGAVTGAVIGAVTEGIKTGSWDGALKGAISGAVNGAADGFMFGAIGGAVSGALNPKFCFVAGTLVMTKQGYKAIEEIKKGDQVLSFNSNLGIYDYKDVVDVYENETSELCHLKTENDEIICTPNHSILTEKGWMLARDIKTGDNIKTKEGLTTVVTTEIEKLDEKIKVYNFNVLGYHTYVIGNELAVVHNECRSSQRKKYWKEEANNLSGANKTYEPTSINVNRMRSGKAPVGFDGRSVELHHIKGINNDFNQIVQIQRIDHINFHKTFGYKNFTDITKIKEFINLII